MAKPILLAAAALAVVTAVGAWLLVPRQSVTGEDQSTLSASAQVTSTDMAAVPDMILGKSDAPVTVIEYASFTCPHCRNFHETVFGDIASNYIDTGKVKFVFREVYFDKYGLWAAVVARCGGPEKYFGIADMLFDSQETWLASGDAQGIADELRKIGLKAGMTSETVNACLNDTERAKAMVEVYQAHLAKDAIDGTPSFVINGEMHGNLTYEEFAKIVDAKLAN